MKNPIEAAKNLSKRLRKNVDQGVESVEKSVKKGAREVESRYEKGVAEVKKGVAEVKKDVKQGVANARLDRLDTGEAHTPLGERTRQQLYNRARQLGIEGRTNMNKDELVAAIRKR